MSTYRIRLTTAATGTQRLVSRGRAAAYKQTHARILLMSESRSDGGMKSRGASPARSVWDSQRSSNTQARWRRGSSLD